jgi:peroxiredoxin
MTRTLFTLLCLSASVPAISLVSGCSEQTEVIVDRDDQVAESSDEISALMAGMMAPAFSLTTADGSDYSFEPDSAGRPIILTFYRGGFCPYCNRQLQSMRHAEEELLDMGYDVLFASMDRAEILKSNLKIENVKYTLLSDSDATLTRAFGLAYRVSDEVIDKYMKAGIDLEKDSGADHHILPTPATYIIGSDGIIDFAYVNPNYRERVNPELVVIAARLAAADKLAM